MKYLEDKHLKILLIFLFGVMNIAIITMLITIFDLSHLSQEEISSVIISMLIVVFLNYVALQVFSDE